MTISVWPKKPFIYQINTWVWLNALSRHYKHPVTLDTVPDKVLDDLASYHVDAVWLMGIWHRSPAVRASALNYQHEYRGALPDLTPADVVGSAYAIGSYQVDEHLGGRVGLALFRKRLRDRGIRLVLDFVPNHVAVDHPWIKVHPDYMVQGTARDLRERPSDFFPAQDALGHDRIVAHGRDPYFPGWVDTAQLNAFDPHLRRAILMTLMDIAGQCDAVRCDMAMLVTNDVFARTWKGYVGEKPATEFWEEIIPHVRRAYPNFLFIAEVYWDMEARLHLQGFDFCYDKRLYDRIRENKLDEIRAHLNAPTDFQEKLVRFIENHDEPRAAASIGVYRSLPAAVLVSTLPGATLLHDGQFLGRKIKLPVQIGRQPQETLHKELKEYYLKLLAETRHPIYQTGQWWLFHVTPGKENGSHRHIIAYGWRNEDHFCLITINMSDHHAQGHVSLEWWSEIGQRRWLLLDSLDGSRYERDGNAMRHPGLYVDLKPYQSHIFHFTPC